MAKITIKAERRFDYDNEYSIDIDTTKDLTVEEYKTITNAIKLIQGVFDPYLNTLKELSKKKE